MLVSAVTGAVARAARRRRRRADEVHALVPFNLRPLDEPLPRELGNRFGLVLLGLPVGVADPVERTYEVKRRMDAIKHGHEGAITYGILELMGHTPPFVEERLIDYFSAKGSMVLTNVPGPRRQLSIAGTPLAGVLVWAPCSGSIGMSVSIFSYAGKVTVGFLTDAGPRARAAGPRGRRARRGARHRARRSSVVELGEPRAVAVVHDAALDLHRRRELAGLLRQVVVEHGEALDLLDPREALVDLVDRRLRAPRGPPGRCAIAARSAGTPASSASAPSSSGSRVSSATRYGRLSPYTIACETQRVSRSAVSRLFGLTFLPLEVMMRSFLRPVMRRKPSASISPRSPEHSQPPSKTSRGRLGVAVVAAEHVRAAHQDLAVGGDRHLAAGQRAADRAEAVGGPACSASPPRTSRSCRSPRGSGRRRRRRTRAPRGRSAPRR